MRGAPRYRPPRRTAIPGDGHRLHLIATKTIQGLAQIKTGQLVHGPHLLGAPFAHHPSKGCGVHGGQRGAHVKIVSSIKKSEFIGFQISQQLGLRCVIEPGDQRRNFVGVGVHENPKMLGHGDIQIETRRNIEQQQLCHADVLQGACHLRRGEGDDLLHHLVCAQGWRTLAARSPFFPPLGQVMDYRVKT